MADNDFEALDSFIGNWFHQDWDLEADNWQALVEKFKVISRKERVAAVHQDLKAFLKRHKQDADLDEMVFEEFGCGYDPRPEQSVRDWLVDVAAALKPPRKPQAAES